MRIDRPKLDPGDQMKSTVEEIESNYKGCISYFGTYEFNLESSLIIHHVESSLFPNMKGRDQERFFELSKNRLQLRTPSFKLDGEKAIGILLWERIE
jgi:Lipocalin-like domain